MTDETGNIRAGTAQSTLVVEDGPVSEIACDLTALTKEQLDMLKSDAEILFGAADDLRILADGFALGLGDASEEQVISLGRFIAYDRLCCKFLRHAIVAEAHSKRVWLYLTGGPGVKEYIAADLKRYLPQGTQLGDLLDVALADLAN